jgi:hypothetical protein
MVQPVKRPISRLFLSVALGGTAQLLIGLIEVAAAEPMSVKTEQPLRDPWVPPDARKPSTASPTEGAALRAQVERKLKQDFDAADVSHTGLLTRQQAIAAGLGFIAKHFDEIDRQKTGAVGFDEVKRYLVERGAQLD